jgi:hypothetical protein
VSRVRSEGVRGERREKDRRMRRSRWRAEQDATIFLREQSVRYHKLKTYRTSLSFFEKTPIGQVVNRFNTDLNMRTSFLPLPSPVPSMRHIIEGAKANLLLGVALWKCLGRGGPC